MNEILLYDTSKVQADYYLQTHSNNPLLRPETISKAVRTFLADIRTTIRFLSNAPADPFI